MSAHIVYTQASPSMGLPRFRGRLPTTSGMATSLAPLATDRIVDSHPAGLQWKLITAYWPRGTHICCTPQVCNVTYSNIGP